LASGQYSYHQYVENGRLWIQSAHRHFARRIFLCLYTFVDDSDVVHSCLDTNVAEDTANLVAKMQQAVDTWEGGLRASGGVLVPTKIYWFLIHFVFERNRWRYKRIDETPGNITIRDIPGTARVELERLDVHEARETLGVFIAMNGNQESQTQEPAMGESNGMGRKSRIWKIFTC
jgi:hypothetical protein